MFEGIKWWRRPVASLEMEMARYRGYLSDAELASLSARGPAAAARFIASRGFLREVLGGLLGAAPASVPVVVGADAKPRLADAPLAFNIAHSGPWLILAVQSGGCIGTDVECLRGDRPVLRLARRFLTAEEERAVQQSCDSEMEACFLRFWVRKEAALKATGLGIRTKLSTLDVLSGGTLPRGVLGPPLRLHDLVLQDGTPACIASDCLEADVVEEQS